MERGTAWSRVVPILAAAWVVAMPVAYLVILLSLAVGRTAVAGAMVAWTVASVVVTLVRRVRARGIEPEEDLAREGFRTFAQRAAFAANAAVLGGGLLLVVAVAVGGVDFSLRTGAAPGLIIGIVGGFGLLAAAIPVAVLNAMWTFSARTAEAEAAVLDDVLPGAAVAIRRARVVAWITWTTYGALAVLLLVAGVAGAI